MVCYFFLAKFSSNYNRNFANTPQKVAWSAADVKIYIPVLLRSFKSSIISSASFLMDKTKRSIFCSRLKILALNSICFNNSGHEQFLGCFYVRKVLLH